MALLHSPITYTPHNAISHFTVTPFSPLLSPPPLSPPHHLHRHHRRRRMGAKPKTSSPTALRRLRRKSSNSNRRLGKPQERRRSAAQISGGESVSDKLEALKSLIPSQNDVVKADQLFQETTDYIVLLKTQVFVLQKLVDFYGQENRDAV